MTGDERRELQAVIADLEAEEADQQATCGYAPTPRVTTRFGVQPTQNASQTPLRPRIHATTLYVLFKPGDAHALTRWLSQLDGPLRPDEVGSPFTDLTATPGFFTGTAHQHHIHGGYR